MTLAKPRYFPPDPRGISSLVRRPIPAGFSHEQRTTFPGWGPKL
ncbi:MAG: hypothetical protein ACRENA_07435 [Vulcanimicrobiaceae bacterium]